MATIQVLDGNGALQTVQEPAAPGQAVAAASKPVVLASDDPLVTVTGAKTDAADTHTDATSISIMSVLKQISKSIQGTLTVGAHAVTNAGTFAVQAAATLAAETTKVIGVVRTADGSGNLLTSTGNALDINIKSGANANGQAVMASSAPVTVASNQSTLAVAMDTSLIANGASGTTLTPTKVKISVASATTTTLVALVAAKKIRILSMYLVSTGANTVTFQSHTTTTNSDGGAAFAANGGYVLPFNPIGWFDTTAGEALDMVTSGAGQVSGQLSYVAV
jgi:hypothetical protein